MDKAELLSELSAKITSGEISREEVMRHCHLPSESHEKAHGRSPKTTSYFTVANMLYVLGVAIVVIGIVFFVSQVWDDIASFGRVTVTLGLGLLFAGLGTMLLKQKPEDALGAVFHCIGGALIPGGALVTLSELSTGMDHPWVIAMTFGGIFVFYMLVNYIQKNAVLTFFAILNGTAFVYLALHAMEDGIYYNDDIYAYLTMAIGVSYLLLAYGFRDGWNKKLIGILYFFGITGLLGAAFSQIYDSIPWQLFYFLLVLGGLWLSVFMKSRSILVVSTLFLIAHISYITDEYFEDSIGWPASLILLGLVFIGLGYASITINKKYITA
jgi:hypothetical protein